MTMIPDPTEMPRLIDQVAHAMTETRNVDLRARVVGQLPDRRSTPWIWRLAPAVGVLAAVLVIVVVTHEWGWRTQSNELSSLINASGAPPLGRAPTVDGRGPQAHPGGTTDRRTSLHQQHAELPSADQIAWHARAVPALKVLEPLGLPSIQPEPLAIRPLETTPLSIAPLGDDVEKD